MAFYHFLAIFPALLVLLKISARVPQLGNEMKYLLQDLSSQMLSGQLSRFFQQMMQELNQHIPSGIPLISVCAGALWAALNGTWAMIFGLNKAYEVEEHRSWREMAVTIVGLTLSLAVTGTIALFVMFYGARIQGGIHRGAIAIRVLEWLVVAASLFLSFAVLYRFAPNLREHEWRSSTPGAVCALILWIGSTFGARFYFNHVDNYSRSYGHLNGAVMLLLWLYVTNGAILIGGEMNSEIAKAVGERRKGPAG